MPTIGWGFYGDHNAKTEGGRRKGASNILHVNLMRLVSTCGLKNTIIMFNFMISKKF